MANFFRKYDRSDETIVTIKTIVMATINTRPRRRIGLKGLIGLRLNGLYGLDVLGENSFG